MFRKEIKKEGIKILPSKQLPSNIKNKMKLERLKQKKTVNLKLIYKCMTVFACFIIVIFVISKTISTFNLKNENSDNENEGNNQQEEKPKIIQNNGALIDTLYDFSNNRTILAHSDYVAIVKIDSVDGVSNFNRITKEYVGTPYTYGKATVLSVIKGDLKKNTIFYTRNGGIMPFSEWIKGEPYKPGLDPVDDPENTFVETKYSNDIDIETGKIYLVYMFHSPEFNIKNEYVIYGYQYGLREIENVTESITPSNIKKLKVKNNDTGEWEILSQVVNIN